MLAFLCISGIGTFLWIQKVKMASPLGWLITSSSRKVFGVTNILFVSGFSTMIRAERLGKEMRARLLCEQEISDPPPCSSIVSVILRT